MDYHQKINALESEKAELQAQLATVAGDEKIAILNLITAKDNQLTELYKHLPSQAPPADALYRSLLIDKRLICFDPDKNTSVESSKSFKESVREAYNRKCLLCGSVEVQLTVAHIVVNNKSLEEGYNRFGPPQYKDKINLESLRNRILLCGTKTTPKNLPSCHRHFDYHDVGMFFDPFETVYKWRCFADFQANGVSYKRGEVWKVNFPNSLDASNFPYKRLLAWRMRSAAIKHASELTHEELDSYVTLSDLSEEDEIARNSQPSKRRKL